MTMMFSALKNDLQKGEVKSKGYTKKKSSISVTHRGKDVYKVYEDKVNMGDPNSDMIPFIREYTAKESEQKK